MNLISKKPFIFNLFAPIFGLMLAASLPGCGYSEVDLCDDACECEGCSDVVYDDCVDDAEDFGRRAENEGCGDYYDDYLACLGDEFACRNAEADFDGCSPEAQRLANCCGGACLFDF
ncbi:MAG: hypothetical protein HUU21_23825 [Polyangiaceae bacterium]|nr:hypothetical protein [Polyangiaceae bacterium]